MRDVCIKNVTSFGVRSRVEVREEKMGVVPKVLMFGLVGLIAVVVFVRGVRQSFTRMVSNRETIVVPSNSSSSSGANRALIDLSLNPTTGQ